MGVEDSTFRPYTEGCGLTVAQAEIIRRVLAIDRGDIIGRRRAIIPFDGHPETEVMVGSGGLKLMVVSRELGLFAKVYWKAVHAGFVATALREISEIAPSVAMIETQTILGVMDRALVFRYQEGLLPIEDVDKEKGGKIGRGMQGMIARMGKTGLVQVIAIPGLLRLGEATLLSDCVKDNHSDLERFCANREYYLGLADS